MPVDDFDHPHTYEAIPCHDKADPLKSEGVEPAKLDQLFKQQNQRFYTFAHHRIPTKLQTAFVAGVKTTKVNRQDLLLEPVNYQELKGHLFEEHFRADMKSHIWQHRQQFKS